MTHWIEQPKLRVIIALFLIVIGVSLKEWQTILLILLFGQGLLTISRVPFSLFWKRLRLILPFMLFTFLFFPLYEQGSVALSLWGVTLSWQGLEKAFQYTGRLIFVTQILTLMFQTVTIPLFIQVLHQLKVPDIILQLILFALRFMEVFAEEARVMTKAMQSRGFRPSKWFSYRGYSILASLIGSLLIRAMRRSDRIYLGMLSRGYQGRMPVISWSRPSVQDWLNAGVSLAVMLVALVWNLW
ncbi:cobalt ECF transporter T component CbiQ [Brevibacillus ginsengisoli]|uniref:cobalt ECF transporter T component CbiQ n=1 Tax=Brevibacillus ginsengisoli TaxID=363854 RepID=UPI003CF9E849